MVVETNPKDFDSFVKKGSVVVDFFATWCAPCRMMAPICDRLAEEISSVRFCAVDVDKLGDVAQKFSIMSIPCFIFFKDGKEVDRLIGGLSYEEFKSKIKDVFSL